MDSKPKVVYEEFEVPTEWVHEVADDTLIAYLPGYRKEQLKVQLTTGGNLRISGQRPIGGNKFSRFSKEIPIPSNCDKNKIKANFNGGMLHLKFPKLIIQADEKHEQAKASAEESDQKPAPPQPPRPADIVAQNKQNNVVEDQAPPPMATMEKQQTGGDQKTNGIAKEAKNVSEKAPFIAANDESAAPPPMATMEKQQTGDDQKTNGIAKEADNVSEKAPNVAANDESESPPIATMEKQQIVGDPKTNGLAKEADNDESEAPPMAAMEKQTGDDQKTNGIAKEADNGSEKASDIYHTGINMAWLKYKHVLDGLAKGLKNPRERMNMVLVVLMVMVLAVYLRNAIRSLGNYWN